MHGAWPACLSPSLSGGTAPPTEAALAPTAAELDYLPEFLERHAVPETVAVEMADAELRARRAAKAKQAGTMAGTNGAGAHPSPLPLIWTLPYVKLTAARATR